MIYVMQAVDTVTGELRVWLSEEAADLSLYPGPNPPRDVAVLGTVQDSKRWGTVVRVTDLTYSPTATAINRRLLVNAGRGDGGQVILLPDSGVELGAVVRVVAVDAATSETDYVSVASDQGTIATLTSPLEYVELVWVGNGWASNSASGGGGVTDHGALTGLGDDDHTQYLHLSAARTITAQHTFNPPDANKQPFFIGANGRTKVSGLNADALDDQHGSYYLALSNATGTLAFNKLDTTEDIAIQKALTVGAGGTHSAIYGTGGLLVVAGTGQLNLASSDSVRIDAPSVSWVLGDRMSVAINSTDGFKLTNSTAHAGKCSNLTEVSLSFGTIGAPELALGLASSKVPLEFRVVDGTGYGTGLTLSPDSIKASGNLLLKDSSGANQLVIATTGSTFQGVPRYKENPLGPGDGSTWSSYFEDFRGVYSGSSYVFAGGLIPVYSGTGSAISTVNCTTNEMGVFRVGVGTTATGYGGLRNGSASGLCFGSGRNYIKTRARISNLSSTDEAFTLRLGWTDGITGNAPTDGAYFRYTDTENGGRWTCVCVSASTETTVDSGVSVAANTWAKLEIEINAAATSAVFKIDGNTVATITTNIPSGGARGTCTGFWITKTAGTTNRYMDLDYVQEVNEFTTPR